MTLRLFLLSAVGWITIFLGTPVAAQVERVDEVAIVVSDADAAADYYRKTLDFSLVSDSREGGAAVGRLYGFHGLQLRTVRMRLGQQQIALVQFIAPGRGRSLPIDSRSQDRWFQHFAIIVSNMEAAFQRVRQGNTKAITNGPPQLLPPNTGGVTAYKFRDPDGHPLELLMLPAGVGRELWHQGGSATFLGIDHSAIGVADTPATVHFYRDLLGFDVVGGSLNQGAGQQALDAAADAIVAITPVRPPDRVSMGIEFLNYLAPRDGRPMPPETRANDIWATELRMTVRDLDQLAVKLAQAGVVFLSPGIVTGNGAGSRKALRIRDPDGHALLLTEE